MVHRIREPRERALHGHAGGVAARVAGQRGDLAVVVVELDPQVQQLTVSFLEPGHAGLEPREEVGADRMLDRRGPRVGQRFRDAIGSRPPARPAHLIPNTVEHRLTHIRLESARAAHLDAVEPLDHPHQRVLHEVRRVEQRARVHREPSARPAAQARQIAGEELVERPLVAVLCTSQQLARFEVRPVGGESAGVVGHRVIRRSR